MKRTTRILANFSALFLLCTFMARGASVDDNILDENIFANLETVETPTIVAEEISLREQNSKHFLLSDGTYTAVAYDSPIHYESKGEWIEIDNSLVSASLLGDPLTGAVKKNTELTQLEMQTINNQSTSLSKAGKYSVYYENNQNDFKVQLPKNLSEEMPVRITYDDHSLMFQCDDVSHSAALVTQPLGTAATEKILKDKLDKVVDVDTYTKIKNEHDMSVHKNRSSVSYNSVFDNVDFKYYVYGQSLKEDIVLDSFPLQKSFTFTFTYTGLRAVLGDDKCVNFVDDQGDSVFTIAAPYMFDSDEGFSNDIDVHLEKTDTGCRYVLTPDREWLANVQRVYPITIDPTVYTTQNTNYIHDNGVQQSDPNTVYTTTDRMYVGSGANSKAGRIYFKLTKWPSATNLTADNVKSARLQLSFYPQASWQTAYQLMINVYKLSASWNTNTITWNNQPSGGTYFTQSFLSDAREETTGYTEFNVTSWVKSHYSSPSADYGIRLQPSTVDSTVNRACFISSDYYDDTTLRPIIYIDYYNYVFGLVGIKATNHDHTSFMDKAVPSNYSKSKNVDSSPAETLKILRKSRAFISRSHGSKTSITCNGGYLTRSDILALPSGALSHMKLVYYGACLTGEDGASAANLVNATYARGAKTVIGFTEKVDCNSTNVWTKSFMTNISNGKTIAASMDAADVAVEDYVEHKNDKTRFRLVRGATASKVN